MYRIELSPGEETAFRTIEELAVAIRRNVVTSQARIWHNATSKWLPIQFHPHYKLAVSMPLTQADLVAGPPVAPLSALKLGESTAPPPAVPTSREAATQAALTAWPAPKPAQAPTASRQRRPQREPPSPPRPSNHARDPAPEPRRAPPRFAPEHPRVVQPARVEVPPGQSQSSRRAGKVEPESQELAETEEIRPLAAPRPRRAVIAACAQLMISAASGRGLPISPIGCGLRDG